MERYRPIVTVAVPPFDVSASISSSARCRIGDLFDFVGKANRKNARLPEPHLNV
jgi:hypothetical protein